MVLRRAFLTVAVVGVLCLPAPLYVPAVADATQESRTAAPYHGVHLADANATNQHGATVLDAWDTDVALAISSVSHLSYDREYRAPNETGRTLEAAFRTGSATTGDPDAMADLGAIEENYTYLQGARDGPDRYASFDVRDDGARVETERVSVDHVFRDAVSAAAVEYDELEPATRRAVDRIVANTSDGWGEYHPRVENQVVDREPMVVRKDGEYYEIRRDDGTYFGPLFGYRLIGYAVAVVGIVFLAIGAAGYLLLYRRRSVENPQL